MADTKISGLPAATTPLAGTEVVPLVQSSTTKKVAVDDLTVKNVRSKATTGILQITGPAAASTRTATVPDADFTVARTDAAQTLTGNQTINAGDVIIGTAGKGVDFTANGGNVLTQYAEGTFVSTLSFGGTQIAAYNAQGGWYTRIGNTVHFTIFIQVQQKGAGTGAVTVGGLPFASKNTNSRKYTFSVTGQSLAGLTGALFGVLDENSSSIAIYQTDASGGVALTDAAFNTFSNDNIIVTGTYQV